MIQANVQSDTIVQFIVKQQAVYDFILKMKQSISIIILKTKPFKFEAKSLGYTVARPATNNAIRILKNADNCCGIKIFK